MAVLAAPAVNWLSSPEPQSATAFRDSLAPPVIIFRSVTVLPAPESPGGGGPTDPGTVGYATS